MKYRIGIGYDVHRLVVKRKLILGGVTVPYKMGLDGHSDADVLIHAVMDSILGALALGDIGKLYPDNDPQFKNINSRILLRKVYDLINSKGWKINNLDTVICAQHPRLSPYINQMRQNLADDLNTSIDNISVKATTEEHLGISGSESGMTAKAVVLLISNQ